MHTEERGSFRRAPRQERSRSTVDAILEAASRLVNEAGLDGATTGRIAHVAGVSVGSLYQYFPRKEALLAALTERTMESDLTRIRAAVDRARTLSLEAGTREVLRAGFELVLQRPRLFVWMLRYMPSLVHSPVVEAWERALIDESRRFLADHQDALANLDLDLHATTAVGAVRGTILILARERPEVLDDPEGVLDLTTDVLLGALKVRRDRAMTAPPAQT